MYPHDAIEIENCKSSHAFKVYKKYLKYCLELPTYTKESTNLVDPLPSNLRTSHDT